MSVADRTSYIRDDWWCSVATRLMCSSVLSEINRAWVTFGCTPSIPERPRECDCLLEVRVCRLVLLRIDRSGGSRDWRDVGSMAKTVDDILFCGKVISSKMGPQGRKGGIMCFGAVSLLRRFRPQQSGLPGIR